MATSAGQLPHNDRMQTLQLWRCEILFDLISKKTKDKRTGCNNIQKHNYIANYISRIYSK